MQRIAWQRAGAAALLYSSSPFHRNATLHTSRGGEGGAGGTGRLPLLSACHSATRDIRRWYCTTPMLHKQLPTSSGSPSSSNTNGGVSSSGASRQGGRKQSQHAAAASSPRNGASAAAAVEAELDATPRPVEAAAAVSSPTNSAAGVLQDANAATGSSSSRAKSPRRGRRKQPATAAASGGGGSSSPTVRLAAAARKRVPRDEVAAPPLPPPVEAPALTTRAVSNEDGATAASTVKPKRKSKAVAARHRGAATATASIGVASAGRNESVAAEYTTTVVAPPVRGAAAPVYSTHTTLDTTPRTEQQRMAERCSITKLIMVSASVSFLFTALPRSDGQLKMYVRDMNRVQVPTFAELEKAAEAAAVGGVSAAGPLTLSSKQFHELRQRLCAEHYATNTVFIHVREMEQLVPPLHLQSPTTPVEDASGSSAAATGGVTAASPLRDGKARSRRGRRGRAEEISAVAPPLPPPPLPVLSPVERLLALQAWKKNAAARAKESQERFPVPAHFHAITRVRFHDPHQTDLTVAMGGGWSKSTDSVLRAIVRSMMQEERGGEHSSIDGQDGEGDWGARGEEAEDEDGDGGLPPFPLPNVEDSGAEVMTEAALDLPEAEQPAFLASPYAVKPLLTVCASCVPRREAWIGTCSPKPSMAVSPEVSGMLLVRRLPAVPRFSTRITIMLEHDDMDPADLVSLAEMSTTRKPVPAAAASAAASRSSFGMNSDVSVKGGGVEADGGDAADWSNAASLGDGKARPKRPVQLYCLVQDAGEY